MATASQVVEQKVIENDIKDVKQKIHVLEDNLKQELKHETPDAAKVQLLEKRLTAQEEQLTALQQRLTALQQRLTALEQQKVLRMQQQAGAAGSQ
jgi:chromosome segregation ATPase